MFLPTPTPSIPPSPRSPSRSPSSSSPEGWLRDLVPYGEVWNLVWEPEVGLAAFSPLPPFAFNTCPPAPVLLYQCSVTGWCVLCLPRSLPPFPPQIVRRVTNCVQKFFVSYVKGKVVRAAAFRHGV